MILSSLTSLGILVLFLIATSRSDFAARLFGIVATISTVFYGILGVAYWTEIQGGVFVGSKWLDELSSLPAIFLGIQLLLFASLAFFARVANSLLIATSSSSIVAPPILDPLNFKSFRLLLAISLLSAMYTLIVGSKVTEAEAAVTTDPLLLIAYQFSDLGIGLILVGFCSKHHKKFWAIVLLLYLFYATWIGFRYRLVLLAVPLAVGFAMSSEVRLRTKILVGVPISIGSLAFLSALTLFRSKFGGIDTSSAGSINLEDMLYGTMAETNILFGLAAAVSSFGNNFPYAGLTPVLEVFTQYIPRFLYPNKNLYQHLWDVNYAIAGTQESLMSGTAMPFFGEYFVMGGWSAVVIGTLLYSVFLTLNFRAIERNDSRVYQAAIGAALLAITFGYLYFGRGSVAQISKAYMFVVIPYLYYYRKIK